MSTSSPFTSPSDCRDPVMEEALNLYVDGELPLDQQAALFGHLAACPACRRTLDSVLSFRRWSRQEPLGVPPALDDAFFKRLAEHKARHTRIDRAADRRPLWQAQAPVTLRAGLTIAIVVFLLGLFVPSNLQPVPARFAVIGEEELVELPAVAASEPGRVEPLYVFYPGLTIEASKTEEPAPGESL